MADFDWVTERANCSVEKVFRSLELGAKSDVDRRNASRKEGETIKWNTASSGNRFSVFRDGGDWKPKSIEFIRDAEGVLVEEDGVQAFYASLTINDNGHCRLRVEKRELEEWQVRRRALEDLFFQS